MLCKDVINIGFPFIFVAIIRYGFANDYRREKNLKRRTMRYSKPVTLNVIDNCWRKDSNWADNREILADCAIGYGSRATGGKGGKIYRVTSPLDDPVNPKPHTLRYAVTRPGPLWIIFAKDMKIMLKMPLLMTSHKTIDGRGANVHISDGPCIYLYNVSNIIIHGLTIHHCKPSQFGYVNWYGSLVESMAGSDGDSISVLASRDIWIDHNTLYSSADGLIDVTLASTAITISNNRFSYHDKVMLLGHDDSYSADKAMKVTVAFNHFGPGCGQRMPRVRFGYAHVVNNDYEPWGIYAIGGSMKPAIRSEGNRFVAPNDSFKKQVTRSNTIGRTRSVNDEFLNGAYFIQYATNGDNVNPLYSRRERFRAVSGKSVASITKDAGNLGCQCGIPCL